MAFSSDGTLYAIDGRANATLPELLYTIDVSTGGLNLVGTLGRHSITGLDFGPDGRLFGWDRLKGLIQIDPVTAKSSQVNPAFTPGPQIQSIAFAPSWSAFRHLGRSL
jgi:hypothetical protein